MDKMTQANVYVYILSLNVLKWRMKIGKSIEWVLVWKKGLQTNWMLDKDTIAWISLGKVTTMQGTSISSKSHWIVKTTIVSGTEALG